MFLEHFNCQTKQVLEDNTRRSFVDYHYCESGFTSGWTVLANSILFLGHCFFLPSVSFLQTFLGGVSSSES